MSRLRHSLTAALSISLLVSFLASAETIHPESWPQVKPAVPRDAKLEQAIDDLLARMTLEEKVGQTIQASITAVTPADVRTYHLGSVLNGGGGWPGDVRKATPKDWLNLADAFYEASMDTTGGRLAIPVMWGSDAVHGHNNIVGATLFPHNVGLGATHDFDLIRKIGEVTAAEMAITGIDWNFSPTVAVSRDRRWGRAYESYSEDPALVQQYAMNMVTGLQGKPGAPAFLGRGKVIATSKHFLGDGGTSRGVDQGDTLASEAELRDIHGAGYVGALSAGVQAVMASYNSWHGEKMHGNRALLTDVLKNRMGFDGIVVGDWNGHGQVAGCTNKSCAPSMNAGLDMFMVPEDWKALYESTLAQARSGQIPMARLDDAVRRILRVKMRAGLFRAGKPSARKLGGDFAQIGSPAHRDVARQAVRESLVLLKNNGHLLPLRPKANVLVAGDADSIAKQAGGWTLTWQGDGNKNSDFPGGTSIWSGIRKTVESAGGRATLSANGSFTEKPDVAIVVFGEDPYAEFQGDRKTLVYGDAASLQILNQLKNAGVPVVAVLLSGRPLWVNPFLNASDAFVAAWLPGTEGGGVAEVLFAAANGKPHNDFRGKLAFSWPKTPAQVVINKGDADYDPLFPLGFGLTYADKNELPQLPASTEGVSTGRPNTYFAGGPVDPWKLYLGDAGGTRPVTDPNSITSPSGVVTLVTVPRGAQESGRTATWSGAGNGEVFIAGQTPSDLSRESNGNLALSAAIAMRAQPTAPVYLAVGNTQIDIAPMLRNLPLNEWRPVRVRLRCFADAGADMTKVGTPFRLATVGQLGLSFADVELAPVTDAEAPCPARNAVLFDDFNYASPDDLAQNGWIIRTAAGWPGVAGAGWGKESFSLLDDPQQSGNRLLRMTSVTNGTVTRQSQLCHQRKYLEGTYAARVRFTDQPSKGPDGDQIVQTFYLVSPQKAPMDPDYSEADFEYLPNGGWGHKPSTIFFTTWETFQLEPWIADNLSTNHEGSQAGWHTLVMQVGGQKVRYFVDGQQLAEHGDKFYPESFMSINFNLWFIRDQLVKSGKQREWVEDIDWAFHRAGSILTPAEVDGQVAAMRAKSVRFTDTVPPTVPPLNSPCDF